MNDYEAPDGWYPLGTFAYHREAVEFSEETDELGYPLWERAFFSCSACTDLTPDSHRATL